MVELAVQECGDWHTPVGRPKVLSLPDALQLTLCRLRRNATYQDLHADFGINTTTTWDYYQQTVAFVLSAGDEASLSALVTGRVCLIDGTLIPTVHWHHRSDLASGKHHRYGATANVQLLVDLYGRILAASRAFPGSWHDVHCFRQAG